MKVILKSGSYAFVIVFVCGLLSKQIMEDTLQKPSSPNPDTVDNHIIVKSTLKCPKGTSKRMLKLSSKKNVHAVFESLHTMHAIAGKLNPFFPYINVLIL